MKTRTNNKSETKRAFLSFVFAAFFVTSLVAQASHNNRSLKNLIEKPTIKAELESTVIAKVEVDLYSNSLDFVIEKPVEVENWMTNPTNWANNAHVEDKAVEEDPALEGWMNNISDFQTVDFTDTLRLEAWMQTSETWIK